MLEGLDRGGGGGGGVGTNVSCRLNFRLLASFQLNCY